MTGVPRIAIIVGSTRPGRLGKSVADWVLEHVRHRTDAEFELVDLAEVGLPMLDEPLPPSLGQYQHAHTRAWAARIASFDGFVFVTPEYNHGAPGALKNAIDFLYAEWNNKAAGFVSYGAAGGARAVEQLRGVMAEMQVATVRAQVLFSLANDFENYRSLRATDRHVQVLSKMIEELVAWSKALRTVRIPAPEVAPAGPAETTPRPSGRAAPVPAG